jgi:hypothetical protein
VLVMALPGQEHHSVIAEGDRPTVAVGGHVMDAVDRHSGLYQSGADGAYMVRTVLPIGYTIPIELLSNAGISDSQPTHIHLIRDIR